MQRSTFVRSSDHRWYALLLVLGGIGVAGLAVNPSEAALMNYTLDGGLSTITGSVGSTNFTNASWVMTATADTSSLQSGVISSGSFNFPTFFIPTTVTLWIGGTSSPIATVTMSNFSNFVWGVVSQDQSQMFGSGVGEAGFAPVDTSSTWASTNGAGVTAGGPLGGSSGLFNNLSSPGTWSGIPGFWQASNVYNTSGGILNLTNVANGSSGTWTIANASAVPGGGVAVLLAAGASRRRRR